MRYVYLIYAIFFYVIIVTVALNVQMKKRYMSKYTTEIKESTVHGKGVFALRNIKEGELIETCNFVPQIERGSIPDYDTENEEFEQGVVIFGIYCFINHGKHNANVTLSSMNNEKLEAYVVAIKDIKKGDELFQDYGDGYWCSRDVQDCKNIN